MSGIAGFFQPNSEFSKEDSFCRDTLPKMSEAIARRGPDKEKYYLFPNGGFCYRELSAGRIKTAAPYEMQPCTLKQNGFSYTILYDGYITNMEEFIHSLEAERQITAGLTTEQLLISGFVTFGPDFVKNLQGGFAMVILDEMHRQLYLYRDPLGLRPLFYSMKGQTLVFASEIKSLFAFPGILPALDRKGLNEIFSMGPARSPGSAVFHNIFELKAGHSINYGLHRLSDNCFYPFLIHEHKDSYEDTVSHIRELVFSSIRFCNTSDIPVSCMLSGGLDSSFIASATHPKRTYSFDFPGSERYFHSNSFQPSLDAPFVHQMVDFLHTDHNTLVCSNEEQYHYLTNSVLAHDLPAMADVDSSLLFFCEKVAQQDCIVLTGECADELFCGYPWYHRPEMYTRNTFPWSSDYAPRQMLLRNSFLKKLNMEEYIQTQYQATCEELSINGQRTPKELLHQRTFYLTMRYFMQTLINRTDRCAAYNHLDARVPFASLALAEYLFNVPYEMKTRNGEVKHLLREIAKNYLPENIRIRKKSPYPKTYDPTYETILASSLKEILSHPDNPILEFVDPAKALSFCRNPMDYGRPWYGQLMAGPQLMAYLIQINFWMKKYNIQLK